MRPPAPAFPPNACHDPGPSPEHTTMHTNGLPHRAVGVGAQNRPPAGPPAACPSKPAPMISPTVRIAHFSTLHPRWDPRIRLKEMTTLSRRLGAELALFVQDGEGDERDAEGFAVIDTGPRERSRLMGMMRGGWRMFRAVRAWRPDIAHFHDPELMPWAALLRLGGVKVVYDVHEDLPRQIRHSPAFPQWLRPILPAFATAFEWIGSRLVSGHVAATPDIAARFDPRDTVLVQNHPIVEEMHVAGRLPIAERPAELAFIGGLSANRSMSQMLDAITRVREPTRIAFAGWFSSDTDEAVAKASPGWARVRALGIVDRATVADLLAKVRGGLILFQPLPNNIAGRPIKLFEYMSAGLPVIASDFPRWREIVEGAGCGLLVDPCDPAAIAEAMQWLVDHPEEGEAMGRRGREAILKRYGWDNEGEKLVNFYRTHLLAEAAAR